MDDDDKLLNATAACEFLGGISKPTLYRAVQRGDLPPPIHVTPGTSRWVKAHLAAARAAAIDASRKRRKAEAAHHSDHA